VGITKTQNSAEWTRRDSANRKPQDQSLMKGDSLGEKVGWDDASACTVSYAETVERAGLSMWGLSASGPVTARVARPLLRGSGSVVTAGAALKHQRRELLPTNVTSRRQKLQLQRQHKRRQTGTADHSELF
jgi:hypothetical protein